MQTRWESWAATLLVSLGVVAVSLLGGIAKMFHDMPDDHEKITRRDVAKYCSCSALAGIILSLTIYHHQGELTPLLFAVAGLGGFGSIQLLGLGIEISKKLIVKASGVGSPGRDEKQSD